MLLITIRRSMVVSSILLISLCVLIAILITTNVSNEEENSNGSSIIRRTNMSSSSSSSQQEQEQSPKQPQTNKMMVGGYSNIEKSSLMKSEQLLNVATFAVREYAIRNNRNTKNDVANNNNNNIDGVASFLEVSPEEVESGVVNFVVLEAQKQVVAGLNYKLTIALMKNSICLGAFKVTVYDRFGDLRVTNWGDDDDGQLLTCDDNVQELLNEVQLLQAREEEGQEEGGEQMMALKVEEEIEEGMEKVEPNE